MNIRHLSLAGRLGLSFTTLVLLTLFSSALGLYKMSQVQSAFDAVVLVNNQKLQLLQTMSESTHIVSRVVRSLVLMTDPAEMAVERQRVDQARGRFAQAQAALGKLPATAQAQAQRDAIRAANVQTDLVTDQAMQAGLANDTALATTLVLKNAGPAAAALQDALDKNIQLQEVNNQHSHAQAQAEYRSARNLMMGFAALSVLAAAALATLVVRSVAGELGGEPAEAKRVAAAIAGGDLGVHVVVRPGDTQSVMAAMQLMRQRLAQLVGEVRHSSDSIATGSAEIATGNADLSQRTEEQASNLQQTAASMEQLTSTVKNNADTAHQANALATGASAAAANGGARQAHDAGNSMDEIVRQVQQVSQLIGEISRATAEQSHGIGQVGDAVGQLDQVTQQNAALVEQSAAAAESLRHQAGRLVEVVGGFRLG